MDAAAAFFIIDWLHDINWHSEAQTLEERVASDRLLSHAYAKLETDEKATRRIHDAISLLNHICGWGLSPDEWQATAGQPLVEELWMLLIFGIPERELESDEKAEDIGQNSDAEAEVMDTATRASIQAIVDYLYRDEENDWSESGSPTDGHIFDDIKKVTEWLKKSPLK